jgi:hypothetical protein
MEIQNMGLMGLTLLRLYHYNKHTQHTFSELSSEKGFVKKFRAHPIEVNFERDFHRYHVATVL